MLKTRAQTAVLLAVVGMLLSACAQLPESVRRSVENMPARFNSHERTLLAAQSMTDAMAGRPDWAFLKPYSEREQWPDAQEEARALFEQAKALYEGTIMPLYKENEPRGAPKIRQAIHTIEKQLMASIKEANRPQRRSEALLQAKAQAPAIQNKAKSELKLLQSTVLTLNERLAALKGTYSHKAPDLTERAAKATAVLDRAKENFAIVDDQLAKARVGAADYAALLDSAGALSTSYKQGEEYAAATHKKVDELDTTFVRVLSDQKIDYYVVVGRSSWCEVNDCYSERNYTFSPVKITAEVAEELDRLPDMTIADLRPRWGDNFKVSLKRSLWQALRIVNPQEGMNRSHDAADYWIEKVYAEAYHRYTNVTNGEEHLTDWAPVSEDEFWEHQEHLGLALVSKPVGYYVEESIKDPEPPGSSMIAEPTMVNGEPTGHNHYGYWHGGFWRYYGQYRIFGDLIGAGYDYHYWNNYRRRPRGAGYYGPNNGWGTYGARTYKQQRYMNSSYAKRNPAEIASVRSASGPARRTGRADPSIRGAGASARNKGPGGRGKS